MNIFVAAFTTCWARLRLYEALELLGQRVVYFDTDSVIFIEDERLDQPQPVLGDYLGDFISELKVDDFIMEFVSAGPKNYGYQTFKGKTECKVKGFRLNAEGVEQLNYKLMRNNVIEEIKHPLDKPRQHQVVRSFNIVRNTKDFSLETRPEYKQYQLVYDKRVVAWFSCRVNDQSLESFSYQLSISWSNHSRLEHSQCLSNRLIPGSPRFNRFSNLVPGPKY